MGRRVLGAALACAWMLLILSTGIAKAEVGPASGSATGPDAVLSNGAVNEPIGILGYWAENDVDSLHFYILPTENGTRVEMTHRVGDMGKLQAEIRLTPDPGSNGSQPDGREFQPWQEGSGRVTEVELSDNSYSVYKDKHYIGSPSSFPREIECIKPTLTKDCLTIELTFRRGAAEFVKTVAKKVEPDSDPSESGAEVRMLFGSSDMMTGPGGRLTLYQQQAVDCQFWYFEPSNRTDSETGGSGKDSAQDSDNILREVEDCSIKSDWTSGMPLEEVLVRQFNGGGCTAHTGKFCPLSRYKLVLRSSLPEQASSRQFYLENNVDNIYDLLLAMEEQFRLKHEVELPSDPEQRVVLRIGRIEIPPVPRTTKVFPKRYQIYYVEASYVQQVLNDSFKNIYMPGAGIVDKVEKEQTINVIPKIRDIENMSSRNGNSPLTRSEIEKEIGSELTSSIEAITDLDKLIEIMEEHPKADEDMIFELYYQAIQGEFQVEMNSFPSVVLESTDSNNPAEAQPKRNAGNGLELGERAVSLSPTGSAKINFDGIEFSPRNALVISASEEEHGLIESIIREVDVPLTSIKLAVYVCEVDDVGSRSLGVRPGSTSTSAEFKESAGLKGIEAFSLGSFFRSAGMSFNLTLDHMVEEGHARILASTTLATLEGSQADYFVGDMVPVATGAGTDIDLPGFLALSSVSYFPIGIKLLFVPKLGRFGDLTIGVQPSVSTYLEKEGNPEQPEYLDIGNSNTAPKFTFREVKTIVSVQEGEPFVLAGMISEQDRIRIRKIPGLGDLPLAGKLFRSKSRRSETTEVCIFVIPHVVTSNPPCCEDGSCQRCRFR
ncbi:type II and III secretion system protein [bacterium]|nr:type II and III secretion system protein [bacterium]